MRTLTQLQRSVFKRGLHIKERIDSNARLLIKKYCQNKVITINNRPYLRINTEIKKTEKVNIYAIHI